MTFELDRKFVRRMGRREFVASAGAAVGAGVLAGPALAMRGQPMKKLRILMLGGTGFLGPHTVRFALERGHAVTLFNRGRTNSDMFADLEKLRGNRDPELRADAEDESSPKGLEELAGREFDAVIDTSAYVPRHIRASAELLRPNIGHYHMVSTLSAYSSHDTPGADEDAALAPMEDPDFESRDMQWYGPLKAECERAAGKALGDTLSVSRPGLIVGPRDPTDRYTYWPWRIDRGGRVLAPGDGEDPTQFIDARDLAAFIVRLVEDRVSGAYNVIGPGGTMLMRQMLEWTREGVESDCEFEWVESEFLQAQGVQAWAHMPAWIPRTLEGYRGFGTRSNARAIAAGLAFTPVPTTAKDTMEWLIAEGSERSGRMRAGITPDREAAVLKAWGER